MEIKDIVCIKDGSEFINALVTYIFDKHQAHQALSEGERYIYLYVRFMTSKDMDGFCDLFYQEFSLQECHDIIYWFEELGLEASSSKFKEALNIYCRRKTVSEEEFKQLEPFTLDVDEGNLFDEIGIFFDTENCGLYNSEEPIREWMLKHRELFV